MPKILLDSVCFSHDAAEPLKASIEAYYTIKALRKQISSLKKVLQENVPKIELQKDGCDHNQHASTKMVHADIAVLAKGEDAKDVAAQGYLYGIGGRRSMTASIKIPAIKEKILTCTRFIKHLKAGDLVKTIETQDNG